MHSLYHIYGVHRVLHLFSFSIVLLVVQYRYLLFFFLIVVLSGLLFFAICLSSPKPRNFVSFVQFETRFMVYFILLPLLFVLLPSCFIMILLIDVFTVYDDVTYYWIDSNVHHYHQIMYSIHMLDLITFQFLFHPNHR